MSNVGDLCVTYRITQQELDIRGSQHQSVKQAARIWSHIAAKTIQCAGERIFEIFGIRKIFRVRVDSQQLVQCAQFKIEI